jgi:hypothetical protein
VFAVGTGLRPEEWIGPHRSDLDHAAGLVHVRRRFTQGLEDTYFRWMERTDAQVRRLLDEYDAATG